MKVTDNLYAFIWQSMNANNCNTYFIDGPKRVLIEPGHKSFFNHVELGLKEMGLAISDIDLIICTHAHLDHLESVPMLKNKKTLFALHETEWQWAATIGKQMSASFGIDVDNFRPDFYLKEGILDVDGLELNVIHTPGHSPGSVTLYWSAQKSLFTGDLVFREGIGRTDLPGGDGSQLKESIKSLMNLDVEWLLSGHGEIIAGADKVKKNFDDVESFYFAYV